LGSAGATAQAGKDDGKRAAEGAINWLTVSCFVKSYEVLATGQLWGKKPHERAKANTLGLSA